MKFARHFSVSYAIKLFLHNLGVLNANVYGRQNVNKTQYFIWFITHESTILVYVRFLFFKFISSVIVKKLFDHQIKYVRHF